MPNEFSVIIPAHNRRSQLAFTLSAFASQTMGSSSFEVIVVDDCSTDRTEELVAEVEVPYTLRYERLDSRQWQGAARNRGVQLARHDNVIFCDSDMLVLPDFLEVFDRKTTDDSCQIVTGTPNCFRQIFTNYYPDFIPGQKQVMQQILVLAGIDPEGLISSKTVQPVLDASDVVADPGCVAPLVDGRELVSPELRAEFYAQDIAPWLLFISRCVSMKRSLFIESGGFDETVFRGEDWELGFRLTRLGARFDIIDEVICYHQAHPPDRNAAGSVRFNQVLIRKFGINDPELALLVGFESSDELWRCIPAYKGILRKLQQGGKEIAPEESDLLGKIADLAIKGWHEEDD